MYDHAFTPPGGPTSPTGLATRTAETRVAVREALHLAAQRLGGVDGLVKWIRRDEANARAFWTAIYPRLLPLKVDGEVEMGARMAGIVATWLPPQ